MKTVLSLKRPAALLLAILLVFACVACDTASDLQSTGTAVTESTTSPSTESTTTEAVVSQPETEPTTTEPETEETTTEPETEPTTTEPETEPTTTEPETEPTTTEPETEETTEPETTPAEPTGKVDTSLPTVEVPEGRIKNIIIVIGDGMGKNHVTAAEWASGRPFTFDNWKAVSVNTDSVYEDGTLITEGYTDSAAAATALASGKLTVNYYVGLDHEKNEVKTILDYAKECGKATGVISTESLSGATPAGFTAHAKDRTLYSEILLSQMRSGIDLLCGHTDTACAKIKLGIEYNGYTWCDNFWMMEDDVMSADKLYWQFDLALTNKNDPRIYLDEVAVKALDYPDQDEHGFVLMIEQAQIDKHSHDSFTNAKTSFEYMQRSVVDLNDTVNAILKWLGDRDDTAILVLADHETGGLLISRDENEYTNQYQAKDGSMFSYQWTANTHTNAEVSLYTYGIDVDYTQFDYYADAAKIKNIDVFNLMYDVLMNAPKYD